MNLAILAPAGGRKTQSIIENCQNSYNDENSLIVTYTTNGQEVIKERLWEHKINLEKMEVTGWYSFLMKNFIYPYIYDLYPGEKVNGFFFVTKGNPNQYRKGSKHYLTDDGLVYSNTISKLSLDIAKSGKAVINRLEKIYNTIYFDEVQDLNGNDLDILEILLNSNMKILMVGDVRQTVYCTSRSDNKHKNYCNINKIEWFRKMEKKGYLKIEEIKYTWRCNQEIIDFADSIFPEEYNFAKTISKQIESCEHSGIFIISWENLKEYIRIYNPECYRYNIKSRILEECKVINFGLCKGRTVSHSLIYPTGPIKEFLKDRNPETLKEKSASALYVAVTRAKHSVAFVVENPKNYQIKEWKP